MACRHTEKTIGITHRTELVL